MTRALPQTAGRFFLTDGGLETSLIFHEGIELPHFAAFMLLKDEAGREALRRYYRRYLEIAMTQDLGFVLEAPTWRASSDWGVRLGLPLGELDVLNRNAIQLMRELKAEWASRVREIVISGCIGPRGDGYDPGEVMSSEEAFGYHRRQVGTFTAAGADMVGAITMTNIPEAIGVTRAAQEFGLPVAVSFTVETDGRLPTGQTLAEAVESVDQATGRGPAYYMVNCAHPTHFAGALEVDGPWLERVTGLRANASRRSHQELNDSSDLDNGDPAELGQEHAALLRRHRQIRILGGCCGTDHRHVAAIGRACALVST